MYISGSRPSAILFYLVNMFYARERAFVLVRLVTFSIHARDRVSLTKMREPVKADRRGRERERGREEREGKRLLLIQRDLDLVSRNLSRITYPDIYSRNKRSSAGRPKSIADKSVYIITRG